jgi:hypothetical protein
MTERNFHIKQLDKSVRYKVGQPMGLLSSWAAFALTHHALIQFCAYHSGYNRFRDYIVIGDDVAIFQERVALKYKEIIEMLGVEINPNKSIISKGKTLSAEITKRIFIDGEEISPIPPDIFQAAVKDYTIVPQLLKSMSERS